MKTGAATGAEKPLLIRPVYRAELTSAAIRPCDQPLGDMGYAMIFLHCNNALRTRNDMLKRAARGEQKIAGWRKASRQKSWSRSRHQKTRSPSGRNGGLAHKKTSVLDGIDMMMFQNRKESR